MRYGRHVIRGFEQTVLNRVRFRFHKSPLRAVLDPRKRSFTAPCCDCMQFLHAVLRLHDRVHYAGKCVVVSSCYRVSSCPRWGSDSCVRAMLDAIILCVYPNGQSSDSFSL